MDDSSFIGLQHALAESLRSARRDAGVSQEALALRSNVDRSYVSQLERGLANPSILILHRIANELGMELQVRFVEREA